MKFVDAGTGSRVVEPQLNLVRRVTQRFAVMTQGEFIDRRLTVDIGIGIGI